MLLYVVVVEEHEVVGERRLKAWVTHGDAQRVAVVNDVEQVGHAWLRCASTIVEAQLAQLRYFPTEISRRGDVRHGAHRVGVHSLIVLNELRLLWHELHAEVEIVCLANDAEHELNVVDIVLIL